MFGMSQTPLLLEIQPADTKLLWKQSAGMGELLNKHLIHALTYNKSPN